LKIIVGPYIGDIEQSIFTFRPYVMWMYDHLYSFADAFYISTHKSHKFMYNWPGVEFIPVDNSLSNDVDHRGIMNTNIDNKTYLVLTKQLKNSLNNGGGDVVHCYVRYTKYNNFSIPISKKTFRPLDLKPSDKREIVIISREGDTEITKKIGLFIPDSVEINAIDINNVESTLQRIISAKMVICPCNTWTYFCNLHKVPVFSWGENGVGMYKPSGVYHFSNTRSHVVYSDGSNIDILLSGIKYLLDKI
jgi:hypothetical protein